MKIQCITSLYIPKLNSLNNSPSTFCIKSIQADCFVPSFSSNMHELADAVLNFQPKLDVKYYKSLSAGEKRAVFFTTESHIKEAAKDSVKMAKLLKKNLDKKYGKDNYVFVCIGTSPACIGRVFEFSGVETKYLPISDLPEDMATNSYIAKNKEGVEAYKEFLTSQGITKEKLDNPKKHIIFYDYTNKGTSLRKYKTMLKDVFDIPTNSDKVEFRSINKDFKNISDKSHFINSEKISDYISHYFAGGFSYVYAGVPHLNYGELEEISNIVENPQEQSEKYRVLSLEDAPRWHRNSETEKRFSFMVMSELDKKGLLKNNPLNEKTI